jgi:hypothetical protein
MLVLSRKCQESVVVGGTAGHARLLTVTVLEIRGATVRLGFEADLTSPSTGGRFGNGLPAPARRPNRREAR